MFPGQRNDLDSLCRRFEINNSHRELHGALLDAEILADVYLAMTGGQSSLSLVSKDSQSSADTSNNKVDFSSLSLPLVEATNSELESHQDWLARLDEKVEDVCVWTRLNGDTPVEPH
jgi:DNA polymerase-3 subunit epsilon